MNCIINCVYTFIIIVFLAGHLFSQNYYVSPSGDDGYPGTEQQPWRTIQKACSTVTPGSFVYIKSGTYDENIYVTVQGSTNNYITFRNFNNDVVIVKNTSSETYKRLFRIENKSFLRFIGLTISGFSLNTWGGGFYITGNSNNIEITNCIFNNISGSGGLIICEEPYGTRNNLLIRDNTISNCNFGSMAAPIYLIKGYGTNIRIIKNTIFNVNSTGTSKAILIEGRDYDNSYANVLIDSNVVHDYNVNNGEAITLSGNVENSVISNNLVYNINNIGIDIAGGYDICPNPNKNFARYVNVNNNILYNCRNAFGSSVGIYFDGSKYSVAERNIVYKCSQGINIDCEMPGTANDNIIRDNNIFDCDRFGILIGHYGNESNRFVSNCKVLNNTLYKNLDTNTTLYEADFGCSKSSNCIFKNNIIYKSVRPNDNEKIILAVQVGTINEVFDYNIYYFPLGSNTVKINYKNNYYYTFQSYISATGQDLHSQFINPLFVDTNFSNLNLHLKNTSPAINSGDVNFIPGTNETDIDRELRVYNNRVDCGSDENQPANSIIKIGENIPDYYSISQNYPNPFNPTTIIEFSISKNNTDVNLTVFDVMGKEVSTLVNEKLNAGSYKVDFNGESLASGVYFYKLAAKDFVKTKKMILIK